MTLAAGEGAAAQHELAGKSRRRSLWGDAWRQFRRNRLAMLVFAPLLWIVLAVLSGPWLIRSTPRPSTS